MLNMNFVYAVLIVAAVIGVIRFVIPAVRSRGFDFYKEIRLGLLMFGYALRDDKLKEIADKALEIVTELENANLDSMDKRDHAIYELSYFVAEKFNIHLSRDVWQMIVNVAVSVLPKSK